MQTSKGQTEKRIRVGEPKLSGGPTPRYRYELPVRVFPSIVKRYLPGQCLFVAREPRPTWIESTINERNPHHAYRL